MPEPHELGVVELRRAFLARELSPVEALDSCARRIEATAGYGAWARLALDEAEAAARDAERAYAAGEGEERPLLGVPVGVKDVMDTAGLETSHGSAMFAGRVPERDAACVARVRAAGAVIAGKTNLFELAWGITSSNRYLGDCLNPWDRSRSAGGSSGGSGAALALDQVPLTLGTDTGGSIRIPAAFCGAMGLKPTFGRVSFDGILPLALPFDHAGPMARRPEDLALALAVLEGAPAQPGEAPRRAGVWTGPPGHELDDGARAALDAAVAALERSGCALEPIEDAALDGALEVFATLQGSEALRTHGEHGLFPQRRDEYPEEIARRLEAARSMTAERLDAARAELRTLVARLDELLARVDVIVSPVAPVAPPRLGEEREVRSGSARGIRESVLPYTVPQNLTGLPACAVRTAIDGDGLPRGVQLTAARGADAGALAAAAAIFDADPELQARRPEGDAG